jgi:DNA-directed RNA polymerase specialized sigma subunit
MSKNYFTQETEDAIVAYNTSTDFEEKSKIYETKIHYAFFKLTQNIIHTFKFYYTEVDNIEDLQHEVITFLLSKIHKFDPSRGAKAYSYFGTIVKRWLILYNETNYKKRVKSTPIATIEEDGNHSYTIEENNNMAVSKLSQNDKLSLIHIKKVTYFI